MDFGHIISIRSSFRNLRENGMLGYDGSRREELEAVGFHQVLQLYERIIVGSVTIDTYYNGWGIVSLPSETSSLQHIRSDVILLNWLLKLGCNLTDYTSC